jgi:hypothetical protein
VDSTTLVPIRIIADVFHKLEVTGSSVMTIVTNDEDDEDSDLDHSNSDQQQYIIY